MFTRKDYLNNVCTHHEYYSQFVTKDTLQIVADSGLTLDSPLVQWDRLTNKITLPYITLMITKEASSNVNVPLATKVCVAKTAYRYLHKDNN